MVERFDLQDACSNVTTSKFRQEHLERYAYAARFCQSLDRVTSPVLFDAACGTGYGFQFLGQITTYLGLDVSEDALALARKRYPTARYERADFNQPDALASFGDADVIVSFETVEHLKHPELFFKSCRQSLAARGGHLIFSAPTCLSRDFDPYHLHDRTADEWRRTAEAAGFGVCREEPMGFETSFADSAKFPSPFKTKLRLVAFILLHPKYLKDRFINWIIKGRFVWQSHLFVCQVGTE